MHKESFELMRYFVEKYLDKSKKLEILDIGSLDVNGTYKSLFQNLNWNYCGLDMVEGPNVDIVSKSAYDFGILKQFDVVISGQCLEHVEAPWKWIRELENVTKKGGIICIITPFSIGEHRFPVDCWRILPDGYRYLLERENNFTILETELSTTIRYRFFEYRPNLTWMLRILPGTIKKLLKYPMQDTIAIALAN